MERYILVPLDGSDLADAILPHAQHLAQATGSGIVLLRAIAPPAVTDPLSSAIPPFTEPYETWEADLGWADNALTTTAELVRSRGLVVHSVVVEGDPATAIVTYAARHPEIQIIAMATHGRSGLRRLVVGSVAEAVTHQAPKPLMLIRPQETRDGIITPPVRPYQTILVPLDGSPLAEHALEVAQPLAAATGATLVLMTAINGNGTHSNTAEEGETFQPANQLPGYLADARHRAETTGLTVQTQISYGSPAAAIVSASEQVNADLVIMATHGRGGWQRIRLGSVAWDVVRTAQRPVLLVPPPTAAHSIMESRSETSGAETMSR